MSFAVTHISPRGNYLLWSALTTHRHRERSMPETQSCMFVAPDGVTTCDTMIRITRVRWDSRQTQEYAIEGSIFFPANLPDWLEPFRDSFKLHFAPVPNYEPTTVKDEDEDEDAA